MSDKYIALHALLRQINDLEAAAALLEWDEETYMPVGGAAARGRQLGTLKRVAHELFCGDRIGQLLDDLKDEEYDSQSIKASLLRVTRRDYERARRVSADLVSEIASASAAARAAWRTAKEHNDYDHFAPHLRRMVELNVCKGEALGSAERPYDGLLEEFEPGMDADTVTAVFNALRGALVPLVTAFSADSQLEDGFLAEKYPLQAQWDFGIRVLGDIGYDLQRGRQDTSAHPFSTSFSTSDVRITTRLREDYLPAGLFGTMHEAGHALYEQGVDPALEGTLLASGTSLGMHESQSRLWENQVGRSSAFWDHYYGPLQQVFPQQLGGIRQKDFCRAINRVKPSLIRVEADEVTYNLHIMVRYELELQLVGGDLDVAALPDAWNDRMEQYLGIRPETNSDGVLQDIHWALGAFGYFPTYALGNLMAAQLFSTAENAIPELEGYLARGEFAPLREWLTEHVYTYGRRLSANEVLQRATGSALTAEHWLAYVERKFGDLYGIW